MNFPALAFLALLTVATFAKATEPAPLAIEAIASRQAQIRADVQDPTGRYRDMPAETRNELLSRQARMLAMLEGKASAGDLTSNERREVADTVEWIDATLDGTTASVGARGPETPARAPNERRVCKREKRLGSNRIEVVCRAVSQP